MLYRVHLNWAGFELITFSGESCSSRSVLDTTLSDKKFVSDLQKDGGFLRVLWFPPPIKLTATIYWNIVENGVKHHKPNQSKPSILLNFLAIYNNMYM